MKKNLLTTIILAACTTFVASSQSAYITKVFEYSPAPGQFINQIPEYETGDTPASMAQKAADNICGTEMYVISLGGFGGYVVFGFDHTIVNVPGEYDFKIWGNTFKNSAEPGIIMVSKDVNNDGLPNDPWYEIAGSAHSNSATIKNYTITYSKPTSATGDISWSTNQGESGVIKHNIFNTQSYYPQWIAETELSFSGTKLPNNATLENEVYKLRSFEWGYADNVPNDSVNCGIKIDWAINADNSPANLTGINFVKVYTALNQQCGNIGETSTEVAGGEDLHPNAASVGNINTYNGITLVSTKVNENLIINSSLSQVIGIDIYSITGNHMLRFDITSGINSIDVSNLNSGIYILRSGCSSTKFIKL